MNLSFWRSDQHDYLAERSLELLGFLPFYRPVVLREGPRLARPCPFRPSRPQSCVYCRNQRSTRRLYEGELPWGPMAYQSEAQHQGFYSDRKGLWRRDP